VDPGKRREVKKKWRAANAERERERYRRWRAMNVEKAREATQRWNEANPEYHADPILMARKNRRARQRRTERQLAQLGVEGYT
jgi:hypothetical protein